MSSDAPDTVRLDIWLWRARFFKTRRIATTQISKRGVRLSRNGQIRRTQKPGANITVGDILTFTQGSNIQSVQVRDLGSRRGPANEARALYKVVGDDDV